MPEIARGSSAAFGRASLLPYVDGPPEDTVAAAPSDELAAVTRRIAEQYLDVLHAASVTAFGGRDARATATQLLTALAALGRLAQAGGDRAHHAVVAAVLPEVERYAADPGGRARHRFLARFRPWLARYADHLGDPAGRRFRALVAYDAREVPLFVELAAIPGIGPRRLERLFCAGLYAVEVVSAADPRELAQVTGLPRALAADVVTRSREYAEARRRQCVLEMRARLAEFQRAFSAIDPTAHPELWALAHAAVEEMSAMVHQVHQESPA